MTDIDNKLLAHVPAALDTQRSLVDNLNQCSFICTRRIAKAKQISNPATLPQEINPSIPQVAIFNYTIHATGATCTSVIRAISAFGSDTVLLRFQVVSAF